MVGSFETKMKTDNPIFFLCHYLIINCVTTSFMIKSDGAHSDRYLPYSPNSGFYYVRNNARTRNFFSVFMRMGDEIIGK